MLRKNQAPEARAMYADPTRRMPELVSVVIPVHNGVDVIDCQLNALVAQSYSRPIEVIVADNGSTDGLSEHLAESDYAETLNLRWVDASAHRGAAYARNVGARAAQGEFIAFCDADDAVYPDWLTEMVALAPQCAAVGGAVETHSLNSTLVQSWRQMLPPDMPYEFPGFLRAQPTCTLGVWRDVFDAVDGFDLTYDRGGEDADFCFRVQLAGGVFGHAPKSLVAYRLRDTERGLWDQSVMCGEGDARLYSEYAQYGMPRKRWYATLDLLAYLILRNPLLPTVITRVPRGRWLFQAGNLLGRVKGSWKYRCFFV